MCYPQNRPRIHNKKKVVLMPQYFMLSAIRWSTSCCDLKKFFGAARVAVRVFTFYPPLLYLFFGMRPEFEGFVSKNYENSFDRKLPRSIKPNKHLVNRCSALIVPA